METTVITPTIGTEIDLTLRCIESVRGQANHWVVLDGPIEPIARTQLYDSGASIIELPENTGQNRYYGHRIFAGFGYLVNTPHIMFIDQDNWLEPDAIAKMELLMSTHSVVTCRRKIWDSLGQNLIGLDDFESVPEHFHDTNTMMFKTDMYRTNLKDGWGYFGWGADRQMSAFIQANVQVAHIPLHLINYTSPERLEPFFRHNCTPI
jgi:hypothetical protein